MPYNSLNTQLSFFLDGKAIDPPKNWQDISIVATFDNDNVQANITTDDFDFVLSAKDVIDQRIAEGRLFEGILNQIVASNTNRSITVFDGVIDPSDQLTEFIDRGFIRARIQKTESVNRLDQQLEGINFGYLESIGLITDADYVDVEYVIDPIDDGLDTAFLVFMSTYLTVLLVEQVATTARAIAIAAGLASSSITGTIGATVFNIANAILETIKLALIVIAVFDLGTQLINAVVQPRRVHKGVKLKTLIEKACEHAGYALNSDIPEQLVYLPSNTTPDQRGAFSRLVSVGTIQKGIPKAQDYGYACLEAFELAKRYLNGQVGIRNGEVILKPKDSDFWRSQSSYTIPDTLIQTRRYNTEDLKGDKILAFDTDVSDEYTITEFTGTNYEVITSLIGEVDDKLNMIKGLEEINFNVCLGSRKERLNPFETVLKGLARLFDEVINVFGGRSNLVERVQSKVGLLRVSQNNHNKPKLLWQEGGQIPSNHRQLLSAKAIYDQYYVYDSFVAGQGQKILFDGIRTGFGLEDFVNLIENRYFRDAQGNICEAREVEWTMGKDFAVFNYSIRQRYTEQLQEAFIEG